MLSDLTGFSERTPQSYFLYVYALCAIPLLFTRSGVLEHIAHVGYTGFYQGLALWLATLCMVIWYYFLPDFSMVRLKKRGKIALAEILGDSHHSYSGLAPDYWEGMTDYSEEQLRKNRMHRHLRVRFKNLSGTVIKHDFSVSLDYSSSSSLEQTIEIQNQRLLIERIGADLDSNSETGKIKAEMPVWLNTKHKSPAFALANEHGKITAKHIKLGICLIIITLLQMTLPLVYVAQTTAHLSDDVFTLFNTPNVWRWTAICNIVFLWMFHSHWAVSRGSVDVIKLVGLPATTESIMWKQSHYSDELPVYRFTVFYKNHVNQIREARFKLTVTEDQEKMLESMQQQRPILYLDDDKDKILFLDQHLGKVI